MSLKRRHTHHTELQLVYYTQRFPDLQSGGNKLHGCSGAGMRWTASQFYYRAMECRRGLAMRIPSVCPSVKRVNCDKTAERYV